MPRYQKPPLIWRQIRDQRHLRKFLTILAEHPDIDIIMASAPFFRNVFEPKILQKLMDTVIMLSEIPHKYGKPLIAMTHRSGCRVSFLK